MNPAIASLSEKFRDLSDYDTRWANYATADTEGVYRLYVLTPSRVEWWVAIYWDQTSGNVALPPVYELD